MNPTGIFSSASDHWSTPEALQAELYREFALTFDPCPLLSEQDGLKVQWSGRVFCNPPYSRIRSRLVGQLFQPGGQALLRPLRLAPI